MLLIGRGRRAHEHRTRRRLRNEVRPVSSGGAALVCLHLYCAIQLLLGSARCASAAGDDSIEVSWDFDSSADDWARASSVEMDAEVQWEPSGTIRGTVRGPEPHLDSPPFRVLVNDRHHVVTRMRSSGAATRGRLELRTGHIPGNTDHNLNAWRARGNASVVVENSSGGGDNVTLAADGDPTTIWLAASNTNEWVTLDLGDTRKVTAVRLQAPGGSVNPRNLRFQRGVSPGGKFATVANLTLGNSSDAQEFNIPASNGRFWRLYVLDGHGADRASLREVTLLGPGDNTMPEPLDFEVINDNQFHVYYVPIGKSLQGILTQLRLRPGVQAEEAVGRWGESLPAKRGDSFEIDWVRIARAPRVKRVRGCIDTAYRWPETPEVGRAFALSNVTANDVLINGFLKLGRTTFGSVETADYGTTKSCLRDGGERITITGAAFGAANAQVFIDGEPCENVVHKAGSEETELTCVSPPINTFAAAAIANEATKSVAAGESTVAQTATKANASATAGYYEEWASTVQVVNGRMPGLEHGVRYLSYQAPPPAIAKPSLSNVAAMSIDVSWEPPSDYWDALAVTGYQIGWRSVDEGLAGYSTSSTQGGPGFGEEEMEHVITVGNVTTTTVRGLPPGIQHAFWVRGLSENRSDPAVEQVDLYGRREQLQGAVIGIFSEPSNAAATLVADIVFEKFNANQTLNHTAVDAAATLGPRGQWSGEGHYGLQLVGTAQIEGCNRSSSCCDDYDPTTGSCGASEGGSPFSCAASADVGQAWSFDVEAFSATPPLSGDIDSSRLPSSAVVVPHELALREGWGSRVSRACGPALRLTSSRSASAGAAWYPREMTVGEGFDTSFTFRLSSPSLRCNTMDGVHTHCRSRGADGLAFVLQGEGPTALGRGGMGMGYAGISNTLAVEFDTHYNADMLESYENHVSVQTRGWKNPASEHESYSLGSTPNVPDLTAGEITARVVYSPIIKPEDVFRPEFQASAHVAHFLSNGNFRQGGLADWGIGTGILTVYVGNLLEPCLVVPLNLEATLSLNNGRAYAGFTAATGRDTWQAHDVLRWSFSSLRQDTPHWPPPVIKGYETVSDAVGANTSCTDSMPCVEA